MVIDLSIRNDVRDRSFMRIAIYRTAVRFQLLNFFLKCFYLFEQVIQRLDAFYVDVQIVIPTHKLF